MFLQVRIDGEEIAKGNLNGTATHLVRAIEAAALLSPLGRGDALALNPFPNGEWRLWPGALVELGAEGVGTLRNSISATGR